MPRVHGYHHNGPVERGQESAHDAPRAASPVAPHRCGSLSALLSSDIGCAHSGKQLPGPSIPGLSFIALIITGSYLLIRPWVRGNSTVSARWKRLKDWDVTRPVLIRRTHRILSTLCLILIGITLALSTVGLSESPFVIVPIVGLLLVLVITGGYMFFRPWADRIRTN